MSLTVAIISPSTTGLKAASVAKVMASSTPLMRSTAARSTTSTPACAANRLARPVKARSTLTPSPATACAMLAAATSSETSPVLQPHHDDFLDAGLVERLDLGGADRGALLQHQRSLTQGVDGDAADRVGRTGGTEFHAACFFFFGGQPQLRGDLGHDRDRDLGRRHRADRQARSARECARCRHPWRPAPSAARRAWRGSFASRARRYRSSRARRRAAAPDRRSWDRASPRRTRCSDRR